MKIQLKNLKGFPKLAIQIALLSVSMMALSFLTETEVWNDLFCDQYTGAEIDRGEDFDTDWYSKRYDCSYDFCNVGKTNHYHWNYRGWIYFFTGFTFFVLSVLKIITKQVNKKHLNN